MHLVDHESGHNLSLPADTKRTLLVQELRLPDQQRGHAHAPPFEFIVHVTQPLVFNDIKALCFVGKHDEPVVAGTFDQFHKPVGELGALFTVRRGVLLRPARL